MQYGAKIMTFQNTSTKKMIFLKNLQPYHLNLPSILISFLLPNNKTINVKSPNSFPFLHSKF